MTMMTSKDELRLEYDAESIPAGAISADAFEDLTREVRRDLRQRSWRAFSHLRSVAADAPQRPILEALLLPVLVAEDRLELAR
ncbi:hypothetical protein [Citreimonas salinaria]|uniref:Uncharacterized protein n=1 Tax=Citreimonas salinaria TaxID=321339 RepID=A0A1H3N8F9_9RHOB|nr:hypothetical protein [Citreimonas salinaria]SDY85128.1 hypothetical protein SAMN05444340_12140 [Citreimonas salinaria]